MDQSLVVAAVAAVAEVVDYWDVVGAEILNVGSSVAALAAAVGGDGHVADAVAAVVEIHSLGCDQTGSVAAAVVDYACCTENCWPAAVVAVVLVVATKSASGAAGVEPQP